MINALSSTPRSSFSNPGVAVPAEPEIKQEDDKDKDKDKDKEQDKDKPADEAVKEENKTSKPPVVSSQPTNKKRSLKDRVNEAMGKPVVSNQPTPRN